MRRWIVTAAVLLLAERAATAAITGWDFEDGTLQGWTLASSSSIGPTGFGAVGRTFSSSSGVNSWDPIGYMSQNPPYGFAAAPTPFETRGEPQDAPVVLRSPTFQLQSGGEISAHLLGGIPQSQSVPPANFSDLSGPSIDTGASTAMGLDTSYQGIALRRESDGAYLIHKARTSNSSGGTSWQQMTFTAAELDPILASAPGALYTLDLIDTAHGTFSNLTLDSVTIPVPAANSLVAGGGLWDVVKRDGSSVTSLATADALLALPSGDPGITAEFHQGAPVINMFGSALHGHFGNDDAYPGGSADRFAIQITGQIQVLQGGDITFGFVSNDGARLVIDGVVVAEDSFAGDTACDVMGTINLSAGMHDVNFVMFETTGADTVELYVATSLGAFTSINQASFELLQPISVPEPAGYALIGVGALATAMGARWRRR